MKALGLLGAFALAACGTVGAAGQGAALTGHYRNLFQEYLGKSETETAAKLAAGWEQMTAGDSATQRLFYALPDGSTYVPDLIHRDVRTEGMSYAMMISVQQNRREMFDRLWKFARRNMHHEDGKFSGYFAWHTTYEGRQLDPGPAPDGEEWFAMALLFASHRWGGGTGISDYGAQAQALLRTMLHKNEGGDGPVTVMFDRQAHEVVFAPQGAGATFTDPSYHLPAFTELWSRWAADPGDRALWATITATSRKLFHDAADPRTGLMPDYASFAGKPYARFGHQDFLYDAWRTLSNPALDHAWWAADPWQVEEANRVLTFIAAQQPVCPDLLHLDGTPAGRHANSPGFIAMAGTAALAADPALGRPAVARLWNLPMPAGPGRYYDGLLTYLGWLEASGRFRVYGPAGADPNR